MRPLDTQEYFKPLPATDDPDLQIHWTGTREERLLIQRCGTCGTLRWYPRPVCHECWSFASEWVPVSGKGKVYSYVTIHHAFLASFRHALPYSVVIIELDEGARFLATLRNCAPDSIRIGMEVEVRFEQLTTDVTLPYFVPVEVSKDG